MSAGPSFEIVRIARLRPHEEIDERKVAGLLAELRRTGVFREPIWVARGSGVILNGHHRYWALRRLGATQIPAWLFDYDDDAQITLGRWRPGPPISKREVVRRALAGELFPIKTTRHRIPQALPPRSVPLPVLIGTPIPGPGRPAAQGRAAPIARDSRTG